MIRRVCEVRGAIAALATAVLIGAGAAHLSAQPSSAMDAPAFAAELDRLSRMIS